MRRTLLTVLFQNTALVDRLKAVSTEVESYKEAVEHSKRVLDELKEQLATKTHEVYLNGWRTLSFLIAEKP